MTTEPGLRERKKAQTRQRISDIATGLFLAKGFDNVTVAEIAEAAEVSKMTVFNYFPRKEDLFFDRGPEAAALIAGAIRGRHDGETPVAALRRMLLDLLRQGHPLAGVGESLSGFWQVVVDSPALLARVREAAEELEDLLTTLFAEAAGGRPDDPAARLAAALVVAACRTAYVATAQRQLAGEGHADVVEDHAALLNTAFDVVERGLGADALRGR
ncbi:TetR/AcrR family transcriptional regulator [Rugosimonospora africana]|uniref:TetR/AcrR family transcriptional regulator n=1 Tax=Rugosimonospora africana TaxID=556532 RepID=UPI001940D1E3|nr:TetR family transcriptional regulator [Rugosimonospora africana]